jgi:hypothetical protein
MYSAIDSISMENTAKKPLYYDSWDQLHVSRIPTKIIMRLDTLEKYGVKKWISSTYALSKLLEGEPLEVFEKIQKWHIENIREARRYIAGVKQAETRPAKVKAVSGKRLEK